MTLINLSNIYVEINIYIINIYHKYFKFNWLACDDCFQPWFMISEKPENGQKYFNLNFVRSTLLQGGLQDKPFSYMSLVNCCVVYM